MDDQHPEKAKAKLVGIGMGYIKYASEHSDMFDLQFSSDRIDPSKALLETLSSNSYQILEDHVQAVQMEAGNEAGRQSETAGPAAGEDRLPLAAH